MRLTWPLRGTEEKVTVRELKFYLRSWMNHGFFSFTLCLWHLFMFACCFVYFHCCVIFQYMNIPYLFVQSTVGGHLGGSQFGAALYLCVAYCW